MNKLFLLLTCLAAQNLHASQVVNITKKPQMIPTIMVGDRLFKSEKKENVVITKLGEDSYQRIFEDGKGRTKLVEYARKIGDKYHACASRDYDLLLTPRECQSMYATLRLAFEKQEKESAAAHIMDKTNEASNAVSTSPLNDTRTRCERNGCFPGSSCP